MSPFISYDLLRSYGATEKSFLPGELIFEEGETAIFYHQLSHGLVKWVNYDSEGKEFIQMMVAEGDCFGELPLFDGLPYAATAVAQQSSAVIRLSIHAFHKLLIDHPPIHFEFSRLLVSRIRYKFCLNHFLIYHDPEVRIQKLFDYFQKTKRNICPKCNMVQLTRQQIADMVGLRVETVIRAIQSLNKNEKLILHKGKVYLG